MLASAVRRELLFSPSAGSCGGQAPQRQRKSTNGGTGAIFQETVTSPQYAPAASAVPHAAERFWERTPLICAALESPPAPQRKCAQQCSRNAQLG